MHVRTYNVDIDEETPLKRNLAFRGEKSLREKRFSDLFCAM